MKLINVLMQISILHNWATTSCLFLCNKTCDCGSKWFVENEITYRDSFSFLGKSSSILYWFYQIKKQQQMFISKPSDATCSLYNSSNPTGVFSKIFTSKILISYWSRREKCPSAGDYFRQKLITNFKLWWIFRAAG